MPRDKGKQRATEQETTPAARYPSTGFHLVAVEVELPLGGEFHEDFAKGARVVLEQWISRYIPSLGIVLCSISWPLYLPEKNALFIGNTGTVLVKVRFEGVGWRPVVGTKMVGKINLTSNAFVGLLIHNTFNATINHPSIPAARYAFDYERVAPYKEEEKRRETPEGQEPVYDDYDFGCWVDRETGEPLGGEEGKLEFTVIGLTLASGLMTILGSLHEDPLNPPPQPARKGRNWGEWQAAFALNQAPPSATKTVRFEPSTQSPPGHKAKRRSKAMLADQDVDTSIDTAIEVEGEGEEDEMGITEAIEPLEEVELPPKKKRRRKSEADV